MREGGGARFIDMSQIVEALQLLVEASDSIWGEDAAESDGIAASVGSLHLFSHTYPKTTKPPPLREKHLVSFTVDVHFTRSVKVLLCQEQRPLWLGSISRKFSIAVWKTAKSAQ